MKSHGELTGNPQLFESHTELLKSHGPTPETLDCEEIMPERKITFPGRLQITANLPGGTSPAMGPEQEVDSGRSTYKDRVAIAADASEHLLALRRLLQSQDYHLALVPLRERSNFLSDEAKASALASPAVLLPVTWKDFLQAGPDFSVATEPSPTRFGEVCIDFSRMEVTRAGEMIRLTAQEFKILKCLVSQPHRVFSRDELLNQAWGYHCYPTTRTVDNHFFKLRQKLERNPARPVHFRTMHRMGYKFVPEADNDCQSLTRLPRSRQRRIPPAVKRVV
jgi:DNA-binding winged helix-turn-helix (wHTH) protein